MSKCVQDSGLFLLISRLGFFLLLSRETKRQHFLGNASPLWLENCSTVFLPRYRFGVCSVFFWGGGGLGVAGLWVVMPWPHATAEQQRLPSSHPPDQAIGPCCSHSACPCHSLPLHHQHHDGMTKMLLPL